MKKSSLDIIQDSRFSGNHSIFNDIESNLTLINLDAETAWVKQSYETKVFSPFTHRL